MNESLPFRTKDNIDASALNLKINRILREKKLVKVDFSMSESHLDSLYEKWWIDTAFPLTTSRRPFKKIILLLKRIIRKLIKFQLNPIVYSQNYFNAEVVKYIEFLETKIARLEAELKKSKKKKNI